MHTLREITRKEHPGVPYFMLGHSMGSYMLRKYLAIHGEGLTGAIIMGTGCIPDNTTKLAMLIAKLQAAFSAGITEVNYYRNYLMINTIISLT